MMLTRNRPKFLALVATLTILASPSEGQLSTRPQPLRGSRASVELMYTRAIAENLEFLRTPDEVYQAAVGGKLKLITFTNDVALDEARYPFVLPQTFEFITQLASQYHEQCGERLVVTSGARPVDKQPRNAVRESVHPTGMAVDFHRPAEPCLTWLRKALVQLEDRGLVEATEERHPPHFHVAVLQRGTTRYAVDVDKKAMTARPRTELASNGEVTTSTTDTVRYLRDSLADPATIRVGKVDMASAPSTGTTVSDNSAAPRRTSDSLHSARSARSSGSPLYLVEPGDNLWTIARRHRTTVKRLQELNNLRTEMVRTGQQLRLP